MGAVQLDAVEAGLLGADRGCDEVLAQLLDFRQRQAAGARLGVVGGAHRLGADHGFRRAHAGVVKLDNGEAVLGLDGAGKPCQARQVLVAEDAELPGEAQSLRLNV